MKIALLSQAGREIAQWREFFRSHAPSARWRRRDAVADTAFDATEWSNTEWSETCPDTLALSGPIDSTEAHP